MSWNPPGSPAADRCPRAACRSSGRRARAARAELLLAFGRVAHAELPQAPRDRVDVLGRRVDEEPGELRHVLVGELPRLPEVDEAELAGVEDEDVRRMRDRSGRSRGGRPWSSTRQPSDRRRRDARPAACSRDRARRPSSPRRNSSVRTRSGRVLPDHRRDDHARRVRAKFRWKASAFRASWP